METVRHLWNFAPLWAPLVVVAAVVYAIWRIRRSRSRAAEEQPAAAPVLDADSDALDSSHIGFAPLVGVLESPPYDRGAVGDAKQK